MIDNHDAPTPDTEQRTTTVWVDFHLTQDEYQSIIGVYRAGDVDLHSIYRTNLPTTPDPRTRNRVSQYPTLHPFTFNWQDSDVDDGRCVSYTAEMTDEEMGYFQELWSLGSGEVDENPIPGTEELHFDGMDWNVGGHTPFAYVTVTIQTSDNKTYYTEGS